MNLSDLRNGDLLAWRRPSSSGKPAPYMSLVRLLCMSDFGHVSLAWRVNGAIRHVEATMPRIQVANIPLDAEIFAIPMELNVSDDEMTQFFANIIGLRYSIKDAARGLFGLVAESDDEWQCAEKCLEFFRSRGLAIPDAYTPSRLVRAVMSTANRPLIKLNNGY